MIVPTIKSRSLLAFLTVAAFAVPAGAETPEQDFEVWSVLTATGSVAGPLLASFELSIRADDRGTRGATTLIRSSVGYQVSDRLSLWLGYARVDTRPEGRPDVAENRYFQQATWNLGSVGGASIVSRTRIEQRNIEGARDTGWRVRQQLRATVPLRRNGPSAVFSTEPSIAINSTDLGASGLNQWRNFVGVNVPATGNVSVELGYLNRFIRRSGLRDRVDHVVPLTLGVRF